MRRLFAIVAYGLTFMASFAVNISNENSEIKIANPHIYFHVGFNSGNVFPTALSTIIFGYANYGLKRNVFESGFVVDLLSAQMNDTGTKIASKMNSPMGLTFRELFNDVNPNVRIGWRSNYSHGANFGVFAMADYKLHQFRSDLYSSDLNYMRYQRIGVGGGLLGVFGGLNNGVLVLVEAAAKYNFPISFHASGWDDNSTNQLSKGVSSHFAVKIGGRNTMQNIGVFVDIDHFNIFNKKYETGGSRPYENLKFRNVSVGVSLSVTFNQAKER